MLEVKFPSIETDDSERESNNDSPWGFLAGLVFGGLAGASVMLMLAPQSGKRTRVQIAQKSIELRDQATDAVDDAMTQARARVKQVKHDVGKDVKNLRHRGQDMVDEHMANVNSAVEAGKEFVRGS